MVSLRPLLTWQAAEEKESWTGLVSRCRQLPLSTTIPRYPGATWNLWSQNEMIDRATRLPEAPQGEGPGYGQRPDEGLFTRWIIQHEKDGPQLSEFASLSTHYLAGSMAVWLLIDRLARDRSSRSPPSTEDVPAGEDLPTWGAWVISFSPR